MTPKAKTVDSGARGAGNWRAFMGRPLWVLSAAAGLGLVLGMTTWAGTALAGAPGTSATGTLQTQISALQRRLSQDESAIGGLRSLLRGVTLSRNGATLVIAGHGSDSRSALKTVMFKGVNVQVVNGTGIETRLVRIVRRGSGPVVTWRRAQMVLLSAQGMDAAAIAKVAFTSEDRNNHTYDQRLRRIVTRANVA